MVGSARKARGADEAKSLVGARFEIMALRLLIHKVIALVENEELNLEKTKLFHQNKKGLHD